MLNRSNPKPLCGIVNINNDTQKKILRLCKSFLHVIFESVAEHTITTYFDFNIYQINLIRCNFN